MSEWKCVSDVKQGTSHIKKGVPCQDKVLIVKDERHIVAALADGLGSKPNSHIAAEVVVRETCDWFLNVDQKQYDAIFHELDSSPKSHIWKQALIQKLNDSVRGEAIANRMDVSTMNCTLTFVCVSLDNNLAVVGRLGDSSVCVIRESGKSEALVDPSVSANATCTVIDKDAADNLETSVFDLVRDPVFGFILTSDGLSNVLYMKGSSYVFRAAEDFFNALYMEDEVSAQKIISERIDDLIIRNSLRDDISYAIFSRANTMIALPPDPTWLCVCGSRNRLQDTYCKKCRRDFISVYQNVKLEGDDKAMFFKRLNADEDREREIIGLSEKRSSLSFPLFTPNNLFIYVFLCAFFCLLLWGVWRGNSIAHNLHDISGKVDEIQEDTKSLEEKVNQIISDVDNSDTFARLDDSYGFIKMDDGSFYLGGLSDGIPSGIAVILKDGKFFFSNYEKGAQKGTVLIFDKDSFPEIAEIADQDEQITPESEDHESNDALEDTSGEER